MHLVRLLVLSRVPLVEPPLTSIAARAPWSSPAWSAEPASQEAEDQQQDERDEQDAEWEAVTVALDNDCCPAFDGVPFRIDHLHDLDPAAVAVPITIRPPEGNCGNGAEGNQEKPHKYPWTFHYTDTSGRYSGRSLFIGLTNRTRCRVTALKAIMASRIVMSFFTMHAFPINAGTYSVTSQP